MGEIQEVAEVSFFDLAWQNQMARGRQRRWRDRRDSLPAQRRRRRARRRDTPASHYYKPVAIDSDLASRGVRSRLAGGIAAALVTVLCLLSLFWAPQITLASAFVLTIAISSLGLSVALIMSARREELVHQLAGRLTKEAQTPHKTLPFEPRIDPVSALLSHDEERRFDYDGHLSRPR